jgi:hypothetical protein
MPMPQGWNGMLVAGAGGFEPKTFQNNEVSSCRACKSGLHKQVALRSAGFKFTALLATLLACIPNNTHAVFMQPAPASLVPIPRVTTAKKLCSCTHALNNSKHK